MSCSSANKACMCRMPSSGAGGSSTEGLLLVWAMQTEDKNACVTESELALCKLKLEFCERLCVAAKVSHSYGGCNCVSVCSSLCVDSPQAEAR